MLCAALGVRVGRVYVFQFNCSASSDVPVSMPGAATSIGFGEPGRSPWVPVYKSMKHTQISALRKAEIPVDDIVEQCRWTSSDMLERYDREQDRRRDKVVNALASLVDDAKS